MPAQRHTVALARAHLPSPPAYARDCCATRIGLRTTGALAVFAAATLTDALGGPVVLARQGRSSTPPRTIYMYSTFLCASRTM